MQEKGDRQVFLWKAGLTGKIWSFLKKSATNYLNN
jgi:hypothetical protein